MLNIYVSRYVACSSLRRDEKMYLYQLPTTIFLPLFIDRQIPVNRVSGCFSKSYSNNCIADNQGMKIGVVGAGSVGVGVCNYLLTLGSTRISLI